MFYSEPARTGARHPLKDKGRVRNDQGRVSAVPIASLAKVMTAYLILRRCPLSGARGGFTSTVRAAQAQAETEDAAEGQSVVAVRPGEQLTERQLLEALLIPSGNNIARMLAAWVAGGETRFVAEQAMGFPVFRQIVSMAGVTLPVAGTLTNYNPVIAAGYAGKTGSDLAAGGCVAFFTHVTIGGRPRIAVGVVLGQGQGSDTSVILGAAGEAATRLVELPAPASRPGTPLMSTHHYPREYT